MTFAARPHTQSPDPVTIADQLIQRVTGPSNTAGARYELNADGTAYRKTYVNASETSIQLDNWLGAGSGSQYEVRATLQSGSAPSAGDALGSWLSLGSNRFWRTNVAAGAGVVTSVLLVEIRLVSTGVVQDSATITLEAESA